MGREDNNLFISSHMPQDQIKSRQECSNRTDKNNCMGQQRFYDRTPTVAIKGYHGRQRPLKGPSVVLKRPPTQPSLSNPQPTAQQSNYCAIDLPTYLPHNTGKSEAQDEPGILPSSELICLCVYVCVCM